MTVIVTVQYVLDCFLFFCTGTSGVQSATGKVYRSFPYKESGKQDSSLVVDNWPAGVPIRTLGRLNKHTLKLLLKAKVHLHSRYATLLTCSLYTHWLHLAGNTGSEKGVWQQIAVCQAPRRLTPR